MNDERKIFILARHKTLFRVHRRCSWSTFNSDNRYYWKGVSLEKMYFIPFPKPQTDKKTM